MCNPVATLLQPLIVEKHVVSFFFCKQTTKSKGTGPSDVPDEDPGQLDEECDENQGSAKITMQEAICINALKRLGMLRFAGQVRDEHGCTLRRRIAIDIERAKRGKGCLTVEYREDKFSREHGLQGRLYSGSAMKGDDDDSTPLGTHFENTRSSFAGPKYYREWVRPRGMMDLDRTASFIQDLCAEYPDDTSKHQEWLASKEAFCAKYVGNGSEKTVKAVKNYINSLAGSGDAVLRQLQSDLNLDGSEGWPKDLWNERDKCRRMDSQNEPELCKVLQALGLPERDVLNKVHFQRRCKFERNAMDKAANDLQAMQATVHALECDGMFVHPAGHSVAEVLAAVGPGWQHKPYRSEKQLLKYLKEDKGFDVTQDSVVDENGDDWLQQELDSLHIERRVANGEAMYCFCLNQKKRKNKRQ